jgi:hypothetical protein
MRINVRSNVKGVQKNLTRIQKKVLPEATRRALNMTAEEIQKKIRRTIPQVFDRPTKYTRNATKVEEARRATKSSGAILTANVHFKDPSSIRDHYLVPQVVGGTRPKKRAEQRLGSYMYPGKSFPRNQFGNLEAKTYTKMLSDVGVYAGSDSAGNTKRLSTRRKKALTKLKASKVQFFQIANSNKSTIYKRKGRGKKNRALLPALVQGRAPTYKPRLPFYKIGISMTKRRFPILLKQRIDREVFKLKNPPVR